MGFFYTIIILAFYFILFSFVWKAISVDKQSPWCLLLTLPATAHYLRRNDIDFLKSLYNRYRFVLLTEYFLLLTPLLIISLLNHAYPIIFIGLLLATGLSLFPLKKRLSSGSGIRLSFLPREAFEWKAGVRKNIYPLALLLLLAIVLTPYYIVSIVLLWLMHAVFISFYQLNEGTDLLRNFKSSANDVLKLKIIQSNLLQLIIYAPVLFTYSLFHPQQILLVFLFLLLSVISMSSAIIIKYCYFSPGERGKASSLIQTLNVISILIPFLVPIPLIYSLMKFSAAKNNLNKYGLTD